MKKIFIITVISMMIIISILGAIAFFNKEPEQDLYWSNLSIGNLSILNSPRDITFYADEIIFKDGNITIVWTEGGVINLSQFDNMIWELGNKTFVYKKVSDALVSGEEQ